MSLKNDSALRFLCHAKATLAYHRNVSTAKGGKRTRDTNDQKLISWQINIRFGELGKDAEFSFYSHEKKHINFEKNPTMPFRGGKKAKNSEKFPTEGNRRFCPECKDTVKHRLLSRQKTMVPSPGWAPILTSHCFCFPQAKPFHPARSYP